MWATENGCCETVKWSTVTMEIFAFMETFPLTSSLFAAASSFSCSACLARSAEASASFFHASQACLAWVHDSSHEANLDLAFISSSFIRWRSFPRGEVNWGDPNWLGDCIWAVSGSRTPLWIPLLTRGLARYGLDPYRQTKPLIRPTFPACP